MSERDFLYLQYHVEASNDYSFDIVFSFGQEREIMYRISNEETDECGYVNVNGDTLVPFGECVICFSD